MYYRYLCQPQRVLTVDLLSVTHLFSSLHDIISLPESNSLIAQTSQSQATMNSWDLTSQVSPYLDRHMIFPLLEFLDSLIKQGISSYDCKDVAAARLALLTPTHMVDYAVDEYKSLHGGDDAPVPEEMQQQRETVFRELDALRKGCEALDNLCKNTEERVRIQVCAFFLCFYLPHAFNSQALFARFFLQAKLVTSGQWNVAGITAAHSDIDTTVIETYRQLARFYFDCGDYKTSRDMLSSYISLFAHPPPVAAATGTTPNTDTADDEEEILATLATQTPATTATTTNDKDCGNPAVYYLKLPTIDTHNLLPTLWGQLACEILVEDWKASSVAVEAVRIAMEYLVNQQKINPLIALQQRTWLLHWALFVYWNDKGGLDKMLDLMFHERYRQAITTNAPHLARYLTAAVLLCKRSKTASTSGSGEARRLLKNLTFVLQDCEYTDPIVEFVNCLTVKFDFDSAQAKLQECQAVLASDFFLCHQTDLFMEEARIFVFENYCRIHNKIDLATVGAKLAMNPEQTEKWIVDLIRTADLDAVIDSTEGCVVMGDGGNATIYEQVTERTRDLHIRSATITQTLGTLLRDARKEKAKRERDAD